MKILSLVITLLILIACSSDDEGINGIDDNGNHVPEITELKAEPSTILVDRYTFLNCTAIDPDFDNVGITWTTIYGSFPYSNGGFIAQWDAPSAPGTYPIKVTVTDNESTVIDSLKVNVISDFQRQPCPDQPTVNYEGKVYNTILIGDQCWLKENLNIGTMVHGTSPISNNGIIEKWCYDNDESNCEKYGGLYQWDEALQYDVLYGGVRGICPEGWHIPTKYEFTELERMVDGNGNELKANGQGSEDGTGNNRTGFEALLSGFRKNSGSFDYMDGLAKFWSSNRRLDNTWDAHSFTLGSKTNRITNDYDNKTQGHAIRCIRD